MGGVDEALDDDVIDDGAGGWCNGTGDELLIAVPIAAVFVVLDEIVEDDEDDDGNMCSALLLFNDAGPVWRSIMQHPPNDMN